MKNELRCTIELRADDSRQSPGRLVGELMKYETRARSRREMFSAGSLSWPDDGIILNLSHDRKQPLMRIVPEVREDAVIVDAPLPDTQRGRDVAVMIRDGTLRGLSVEFQSQAEGLRDGLRDVKRARLTAAALVDDGDYGSVEVRHGQAKRRARWL